jgi:hypothetical protein
MRISWQSMNRLRLCDLLCCGLVACNLSSTAHGETSPFTISVSAEDGTVKAGADVWIKIVVTNSSDQTIYVTDNNPAECEYDAQVWDARTHTVTRDKDYGLQVKNWRNHAVVGFVRHGTSYRLPCMSVNDSKAMLKPGTGDYTSVTNWLQISDLYDMSGPGQYTVRLQRKVPKGLHSPEPASQEAIPQEAGTDIIKSNTITVTITE